MDSKLNLSAQLCCSTDGTYIVSPVTRAQFARAQCPANGTVARFQLALDQEMVFASQQLLSESQSCQQSPCVGMSAPLQSMAPGSWLPLGLQGLRTGACTASLAFAKL